MPLDLEEHSVQLICWGGRNGLPQSYYPPGVKGFANNKLFKAHYKKHVVKGNEWGYQISESAYLKRAQSLLGGNKGQGVLQYHRGNGDLVRFNTRTGEYGIATGDGTIRTLFRPQPNIDRGYSNALEYFLQDRMKHVGY